MKSCWHDKPEGRPSFDTLNSHVLGISERYTPIPVLGSGHSTPAPSNEIVQHSAVRSSPQYVPVSTSGNDDRAVGVAQGWKASGTSPGSIHKSRDSLQPDKLSITFSVLSGDQLGDGGGSSSDSNDEEERETELIDVLEPELLDRFMPSLRRIQETVPMRRLSNEVQGRPVLTLTSPSGGASNNLEGTSTYSQFSNAGLSPGPRSPTTTAFHLSPSETHSCSSSQYGPSTVRSDETPVPTMSSPSPDLTSKTSTIGDETMSTISNPLLTGINDTSSKTSTMDSMSTAVSASAADYTYPPNLIFAPHLNGNGHRSNGSSPPLPNGHPPGKANGNVIEAIQSPPHHVSSQNQYHSDISATLDQKDSTENGVVLREGLSDRQASRDSRTSQISFGLGLGDLSSDLLSAFDTSLGKK